MRLGNGSEMLLRDVREDVGLELGGSGSEHGEGS